MKSFLQHTKRRFGLPVLLLSALVEERALTDHPVVVIVRDTARRKKVASSDNMVLEGEGLGSKFPTDSPRSYYNHQKSIVLSLWLDKCYLLPCYHFLPSVIHSTTFRASSERIDYVPQMTFLPWFVSRPCFDNLRSKRAKSA